MASAIFFLDLKGKPLLSRNYRGDIPMSAVDKFPMLLLQAEEESPVVPPCFTHEGVNYLYITHNNLYLLALTKRNTNAAEILLFLHRVVQVLTEYFKGLEEESIRDNFVLIYELLDELMDYGFPQTTDTKILKEYITQKSHILEIAMEIAQVPKEQPRPPMAVTNAVSWRSEGIKYRKNEAFLDVVEAVNLLLSPSGQVLRSEVLGSVQMKCYLSGMPELRLGLNDKVLFDHVSNTGAGGGGSSGGSARASRGKSIEMEDVKFHQCVRLSRFENDRTISFIPPDGQFELMSYRLNTTVKPLIWVDCKINKYSNTRIEILAKARGQFKKRSTANNVEIHIPVPEDADSPKLAATAGSIKWHPEKACVTWKIKQFGGGREFSMRAELGLPSVQDADEQAKSKRPIQVKFSIPYFTTSGIQVRYLKIVEPKLQYTSYPWVRYITTSGEDYTIRLA
ncbi:AP-1 complex subunit mu [Yarrowia sp. C11]|nr:AP-1 complex subunit mu [Yarrowia sp. B02]KAG5368322.1 AP-1 complex subunit mu [Yarrowia sp. E02]KAG5372860.1 AP-1 complex subunit mu [Yarrowia sp. C11]